MKTCFGLFLGILHISCYFTPEPKSGFTRILTTHHYFCWFTTFENKTPMEKSPKFPSIIHVIDRLDRNPLITKFWKRFLVPPRFVFQSGVSTKTVVITKSEVVMGKSQAEVLPYLPSDSEVNVVGQGLRFSHDRTVEVIKLFIIWHQQQKWWFISLFALFLQACNRPVDITGE